MLSAKAVKTEIACRFCWMCRHACPVGLQTGKESNTPRAKALLLDMVEKGADYSESMGAEMYECCLCGACMASCETGFDPRIFIREARSQALVDDLVPPGVRKLMDSLKQFENVFSSPTPKNPAARFAGDKADILLYAGATATAKTPAMVEAVARLLNQAGAPFVSWEDEPASGAEMADLVGHVAETVAVAEPLVERIRESGVKKVVCVDPYQTKALRHDYPAWGRELGMRVETATEFLADLVRKGKLRPGRTPLADATYHDTSRLARDLEETEPARELLRAMHIDIREMFLNRTNTRDCGDVIMAGHSPRIGALLAAGRWEDVRRCGATCVVAPCPNSYLQLDAHKPEAASVKSLFCLLADACAT